MRRLDGLRSFQRGEVANELREKISDLFMENLLFTGLSTMLGEADVSTRY